METPNKPNSDHKSTEAEAHVKSSTDFKSLAREDWRAPRNWCGDYEAGDGIERSGNTDWRAAVAQTSTSIWRLRPCSKLFPVGERHQLV